MNALWRDRDVGTQLMGMGTSSHACRGGERLSRVTPSACMAMADHEPDAVERPIVLVHVLREDLRASPPRVVVRLGVVVY